jgi:hypothetical protein
MSIFTILLEFIPDLVWVLLFFVGVTMMIAGQFLRGVPVVMQYRLPIMFAGFFVLMVSTWAMGAIANESKWQARLKEVEEQVKEQEAKATELNQQLEREVAEKKELAEKKNKVIVNEIVKWQTKEVLKEVKVEGPERVRVEEVIKYIENCPVPKEMLDIHNKATMPTIEKMKETKGEKK